MQNIMDVYVNILLLYSKIICVIYYFRKFKYLLCYWEY